MTGRTGRQCGHPGCDHRPSLGAKYCSENCRRLSREQDKQEEHIRNIFQQAASAGKAEPCRRCPGAYVYQDERGQLWCMCGRDATPENMILRSAA